MDVQAREDFMSFTGPDPETAAAAAAQREKEKKAEKKNDQKLKPEQIKAAQNLTDSMKADAEADEKFALIQKLHDYVKLVKEYHPERVEFLKVPKNFGPKNSIEELRFWLRDIQNELGKKGGLDVMKTIWVESFKIFEQINSGGRFGLHVDGIGQIGQNSIASRMTKEGDIVPGPAVPTLAEFCAKHSNWFSTDVDVRLLMMYAEIIAGVHRMNTSADLNVKKATETPVSKTSEELMKKV